MSDQVEMHAQTLVSVGGCNLCNKMSQCSNSSLLAVSGERDAALGTKFQPSFQITAYAQQGIVPLSTMSISTAVGLEGKPLSIRKPTELGC